MRVMKGEKSVYNKVKAKTDLKGRRDRQKFLDPLHDQAGGSIVYILYPAQGMLQWNVTARSPSVRNHKLLFLHIYLRNSRMYNLCLVGDG